MWDYTRPRAAPVAAGGFAPGVGGGQPHVALKTRRSLRAVHFHPHGRPLMLTAEVRCCSMKFVMLGGCYWVVCCSSWHSTVLLQTGKHTVLSMP
jgi:hypothetical protein